MLFFLFVLCIVLFTAPYTLGE